MSTRTHRADVPGSRPARAFRTDPPKPLPITSWRERHKEIRAFEAMWARLERDTLARLDGCATDL